MDTRQTRFRKVSASLNTLLGKTHMSAVCRAQAALSGRPEEDLMAVAAEKVDFYPSELQARLVEQLSQVGEPIISLKGAAAASADGATSRSWQAATKEQACPLSSLGYYRVGEDGVARIITKAEHYHVALGHCFPGYRLIANACRLGMPNATHNNTRGHVTRLLEEELVRVANGIDAGDRPALEKALRSRSATALNRVLNLQTGSLAAEAALKMLLSRFYKAQADSPEPKYAGKTPVFVVIGEDDGGLGGNYHGTTVTAQMLRGMWAGMYEKCEKAGLFAVRGVRPNNMEDLERVFAESGRGDRRIAGFIHELVLMNYGSRLLDKKFMARAYALCKQHDALTVVDEIQSCIWSPEIFMYREYGLKPTMVVLGKGMSGGEYAGSRLLFSPVVDVLPQFGALVTNGQEELASLAYLITMRWAEANRDKTREIGEYYESRMREIAAEHRGVLRGVLRGVAGRRHMMALVFDDVAPAKRVAAELNRLGMDISVQTYKTDVPPAALTKLPITFGYEAVDVVLSRIEQVLKA